MTTPPLISVIIPTYNCARWIDASLESAFAQTYPRIEVIVVDDESTDDTARVLAPWRDRIRYVRQTNGGPSKARNRGIAESTGELIAFLDADDLWLPEKLTKQWQALTESSGAGLIHTDTYQQYEPAGERVLLARDRDRFKGSCYAEFFWGNRVHTSTVLVTRESLDDIGVFDEGIRRPSTEDLDLWMRIAKRYPLAYVAEPLAVYRHHETNGSLNQRQMVESEYYVLDKTLKADPSVWTLMPRARLQRRLSTLAMWAGYENNDAGDPKKARGYFRDAITHEPLRPMAWATWAATFLPSPVRSAVRRIKRAVT